jgi:lactate dehydrogenase-like 2-hydroxyacid dehydrogenase
MTRTVGFIESGAIGSALARLAAAAGLDVVLSNSCGPDTLAKLVAELGDHARAARPAEAARAGDLVVATVPFNPHRQLPAEALVGKILKYEPHNLSDVHVGLRPCSRCRPRRQQTPRRNAFTGLAFSANRS